MALCTLALVGAMIVTALYSVGELRRGAARLGTLERARFAAERGMMLAIASAPDSLLVGETRAIVLDDSALRRAADESVAARVTELAGGVRRFTVEARAGHGMRIAEQGLHALATLEPPHVELAAAITAGSTVTIAAGWEVSIDSVLACVADVGAALASVQLPSLSGLDWAGAPPGSAVEGPSTAAAVMALLAPRASHALAAGSRISPGPIESGGRCVPGEANWGSASGACMHHRPLVLASGDLRITGGEGQGVLLVAGGLTVEGPFRYTGLIVSSGPVVFEGPGMQLEGAIMTTASHEFRESGVMTGSPCAVLAALRAAARWELVPQWGWGGIR